MTDSRTRSHANLELASRRAKARKVIALVESRVELTGASVLEIGTGAGVIASELARSVAPDGNVFAVDVVDQRQVVDGYEFHLVSDTKLPFDDESFDLVISNHVIEHVGDRDAQHSHLREIHRVLYPGGLCYLAVPNRWAMIEPHYRLPLLSWFPPRLRDRYVRWTRMGPRYDIYPPSPGELVSLTESAGFVSERIDDEAIRQMARIEMTGLVRSLVLAVPTSLVRLAGALMPTMIVLLRRSSS